MARGAAGDEKAFRILVERWERSVYGFLLKMLGDPEEAEDQCQETFLRMIRSAPKYKPTGQFRNWLFRIAGNRARSRLRRRRIIRWLSLDQVPTDPPIEHWNALEALEKRELRDRVRRAIAALPPRQREALLLKRYLGLKYEEIARVMGGTEDSVQALLHRAMTALRRSFQARRRP